ncbi:MAG: condensation domain-containing protein, partial [Rhodobacteraceae bacterium]|nr:condensation domain-containing protein [Paracoccaceae bacterium]
MSVSEILAEARRQQVELFLEKDALRFRAYGSGLSTDLRQRLTAEKAAIIAFLRERKQALPVRRADLDNAPAVLTQAQQRMYFLHHAEGDGRQCNMAFAFDLEGEIAGDRLQTALRAILDRHVVLRTVYEMREAVLFQIPRPATDFRLTQT